MFIERYVELDIDKVKRSIPLYCENKLSYFRREKSGNYTFMIKDGFTHELHMNLISYEILRLCLGKQSIKEICHEIANRYPDVKCKRLEFDIIQIIKQFDALNLIDWGKDGSPFMKSYEKEINGKFVIKLAEEKDIRDVSCFYKELLPSPSNEVTFYLYPPRDRMEYLKDLFLRHKFFSYSEDFFLVSFKDSSKSCGIVSIKSNKAISSAGVIGTIGFRDIDNKDLVDIMNEIINSYISLCFQLCKKIEFQLCPSKENYSLSLEKALLELGAKKEAVLKSEFPEENGDIIIYSYFLSKEDGR